MTTTADRDQAPPIPREIIYDYERQTRLFLSHSLAHEQDPGVRCDNSWR